MLTKDFLQRVTAQTHEIVITTLTNTGIFWNRGSYSDLDEAVTAIQEWDAEPNITVYYSIGNMHDNREQKDNGKTKILRTQACATNFKTLCFDLDVGEDKPYKDLDEGLAACMPALKEIGMPKPLIIGSGKGAHVYWPTLEIMDRDTWEKWSIALRVALQSKGVEIDTSKIHDPSMVLRPVGTHHKKDPQNWKLVDAIYDSGNNYHTADLFTVLQQWENQAVASKKTAARAGKPKSAVAAAILDSNTILLDEVAKRCKQIGALIASGGVTDAAGDPVEEPMWRASIGFAKYCEDPEAAIIAMAGQHPDFDLDTNLAKMDGWKGTGPTTCGQFELRCASGCIGCPHRGNQKSPASLSVQEVVQVAVENEDTGEVVVEEKPLPPGYSWNGTRIVREDKEEVEDEQGNMTTAVSYTNIAAYNMYIEGIYKCEDTGGAAFRLFVKYPLMGWKGEDHPIGVLGAVGKEFSDFLLNRLIIDGAKTPAQKENLRKFLMDYLSMVQAAAPIGYDYYHFGWQESGSFLCGEQIIGCSEGSTQRRLKGGAKSFQNVICPKGSREKWIAAMDLLNNPGSETIRSAVLLGTSGILAKEMGDGSMLISIYSPETTTGKTLALAAVNSLIGDHNKLFLKPQDTGNSFFGTRGVLNNLPATMDEITTMRSDWLVDLIYDISSGREKKSMTRNREQREPARWDGPTFTTANTSVVAKYEHMMSASDPMAARVMELGQHDKVFISPHVDEAADIRRGEYMFRELLENNGWAFPELVTAVAALGGAREVARKGRARFKDRFNFVFLDQERKWRSAITSAWIMGTIGARLGLFPFDIDGTIQHLLDHTVASRGTAKERKVDVLDVLGQFLQEHNDKLVLSSEIYGSKKEQVQQPAPTKAVGRLKRVYDDKNSVLPGSVLALNTAHLRKWLIENGNQLDHFERELDMAGVLISKHGKVRIFAGVPNGTSTQSRCHMINMNHSWFIDGFNTTLSTPQSQVLLAVLQGAENG